MFHTRARIPATREAEAQREETNRLRLEQAAEEALLERGFRPLMHVGNHLELRDLFAFDVVLPPNRDMVIAYGCMYNGTLVAQCDSDTWDYELLLELHRRGKWKFKGNPYKIEADVVGRADRQNQRMLRKYDQRWGIVMKDGKTWIKKENGEENEPSNEGNQRPRTEVGSRSETSRFSRLQT